MKLIVDENFLHNCIEIAKTKNTIVELRGNGVVEIFPEGGRVVVPQDIVDAIFAAVLAQPMAQAMLGQALTEDLCVKALRHLFPGEEHAKG